MIAAALTAPFVVQSAAAQTPHCGARGPLLERLEARFGERVVHRGISAHGAMLEIAVNRATGTWTIVMTIPRGPTCIVGSGDGWRDVSGEATDSGT